MDETEYQKMQAEVRSYERMHTNTLYDLLDKGWLSAIQRKAVRHILDMRAVQPLLSMQAAARHPLTLSRRTR